MAHHAGAQPPTGLSDELRRQTDGNPFFLGALLAHLDDVAFVRGSDGAWITATELETAGVPAGVRAVIGQRLATLSASARRTLEIAAVCGSSFEERILTGVSGGSADDRWTQWTRRLPPGLVREEAVGRYVFAHALVRQSVLDAVSRTRQARLHWRVGEQLERR